MPAGPGGDSSSWETLSWTGLGAHTPGQETQPHPFLCLLRPARVFPHLRGAQSTESRADPLPLMLINVPPLPPSDPHGGTHPTSFLCAFWYQPGKGNLKIKPGPECVPLDWAPVLTDLLILGLSLPSEKTANSLLSASRWKCAPAWLGLSLCQGYKQPLSFSRTE